MFDKVIEFITNFLTGIAKFLEWFNNSGLPEETGVVLKKLVNFGMVVVMPLLKDYTDKIAQYFNI